MIMNAYELKQVERRERFETLAAKNREGSERAFNTAHKMASVIPFGQPILIGHHSEGRDRNYRARISSKYEKSAKLAKTADYYEGRAQSMDYAGISSDDPSAVAKLREKIEKAKKNQAVMISVNKLIRANKDNPARIAAIVAAGLLDEAHAAKIVEPDCFGGLGFAGFALTNNSANIRRMEKRIAELSLINTREEKEEQTAKYTYREDAALNRVMFFFPGKPSPEIRTILKQHGFRWCPTNGAWQRQLNGNGLYAAKSLKELI
jgi:hypothetical protein